MRIAEQVRSAEEQVRAATAARELAQKRLGAEEALRAAGLSTNFLVLQAQRDLAAAQTRSSERGSIIEGRSSTSTWCSRRLHQHAKFIETSQTGHRMCRQIVNTVFSWRYQI